MSATVISGDEKVRVFSEAEARRIIDEIVSYMRPQKDLFIQVSSWWGAGQRWARNRASLTSDQREVTVTVGRTTRRMRHGAMTNQTDSVSLKGIAEYIDFYADLWRDKIPADRIVELPRADVKGADVWEDETFSRSVMDNASAVENLTRLSEADQLLSAGYIETTGSTSLRFERDPWNRISYEWGHVTQAQCSVTVRHPKGTGSGWAGKTSFDMNKVDVSGLAKIAFEKCKKSLDPVRIEPGRYQTILEPQAAGTLVSLLVGSMSRSTPEVFGDGVLFLGADQAVGRYRSKLGLKIVDERISIFHDPADPVVGSHIAPLHRRIDLIKDGILTGLQNQYKQHLNEHSDIFPVFPTSSYSVKGGDTSMEEMISSTKRGILVSRLENVEVLDADSLLFGGVTRDGLWLIENGVITKAIRNFRWTESPLFALNNLEQIGIPEQIFNPVTTRNPFGRPSFASSLNNVSVPPLKVNDFSFTSTIDAI